MRNVTALALLGALSVTISACAPTVPDSGAVVAFDNYDAYSAQRDAELEGRGLQAPSDVSQTTLDGSGDDEAKELAAAAVAAARNSGEAPLTADPNNPPPALNNPGISDENNFEAVSERETIQSDKERLERNRELYRVVTPTAVPQREDVGPNIVDYALNTSHNVGQSQYSRGGFNAEGRFQRNCAKYASSDQAQRAFLSNGGPDRDRLGLDPDGDGFACAWDPAPFRSVRSQ
ncbi:hypothetical protein E0K89_014810 [Aquicoccus sp. SCR17]|nr:hypothetical protein [Carideicomes alvinocaridis]